MNLFTLIFLFIFFSSIAGGKSKDVRRSDLFTVLILLSVFGGTISVLFSKLLSLLPILGIAGVIWFLNKQKKKNRTSEDEYQNVKEKWERERQKEEETQRRRTGTYHTGTSSSQSRKAGGTTYGQNGNTSGQNKTYSGNGTAGTSYAGNTASGSPYAGRATYDQLYKDREIDGKLPKRLNRRAKNIRKFSDEYRLNLTDAEVQRIAEASYVSAAWKREVAAMTDKYETDSQWLTGETDWLRAYMYVFRIQDISSDFQRQHQICLETFDEVVAYGCENPEASMEEVIEKINNRYLSDFDENTFMIAYRFLERNGRKYTLPKPNLVKNVDRELEEAMERYEKKQV